MTDGFLIISSLTCCFWQERHHAINHFHDNITDAQRARVGERYYCVLTSEGHWKWWNFKYSKKINPKREIWQESLLKGHLDTDLLALHTSRNLICEFPDIMPSIITAWTDKVRAAENVGTSFGLTRRNGGWSVSRLGKGSHTRRDSSEASCVSWEVADFTGHKLTPKKLCSQHKLSFHCHSCLQGTMKTVPQVQGSSTVFQQ